MTSGQNGLVVPYGDPEALRAALVRLAADDGLRKHLATAARASAARFPFEQTVTAFTPNAWVTIASSGAVTITCGRSEIDGRSIRELFSRKPIRQCP